MVLIRRTAGTVAVGLGPGVRLIHLREASLHAAVEQLLEDGRLTLPHSSR